MIVCKVIDKLNTVQYS